ncbi:MAG: hypothetical protein K8R64_08700 [Methanosarcinaceae archaeon]|nr:hypothetical protein [Methanosarcinaceae archaeon]
MKRTILSLMLISILFISPVGATLLTDLNVSVTEYNQNVDKAPEFMHNMFGDETIHLIIAMNDGSILELKAVTESITVIELEEAVVDEVFDDAITITTDENTVRSIMDSQSPADTFINACLDEQIDVNMFGLLENVTFVGWTVIMKITRFLGLL